ncbi:hypothetical protein GNE08_12650 [Trichormus variabilis ARAD]|uniref:Uncharacterized protein n=1 Tax=Trichormus variabilis N2B TaxID=2681315 RepID=A0ABR6SBG4_ANAVA|nr:MULTISPECIES: hypothetical protein [Nostocaceae]MBC1215069.1 hypothetical protein [Trichormus variabilis ARAD]MBC1254992.1 hypothetical protein [Trichormus variabilis V5]MBC1267972.1 hypothetical protein [Trichormus variabilis FSR]MBC1303740.1 hypothetical protein [Trichormus variabilis N2B]MBC1312019.1 hypothetical protein [Trichormus variabilis PNB]
MAARPAARLTAIAQNSIGEFWRLTHVFCFVDIYPKDLPALPPAIF